jgi:hypothetical protein
MALLMSTRESEGKKSGWLVPLIKGILEPGVTTGLLGFTRIVILLMMGFFLCWAVFVDYNIHFMIMAALSLCLFLSFEYFAYHLKKEPALMKADKTKSE